VLRIENGTKALVIGVDGPSRLVRLLDGYKVGSEGWVEARYVTAADAAMERGAQAKLDAERSAASESRRAAAEEEARIKIRPGRAASLLQMRRNLEAGGKKAAALESYRKVVDELGDTPSAKAAAEWIKALTGTRAPDEATPLDARSRPGSARADRGRRAGCDLRRQPSLQGMQELLEVQLLSCLGWLLRGVLEADPGDCR
jgi:hypothetical protein